MERLEGLEADIRREKAETLLRISRTLDGLVGELERERVRVERLVGEERALALERYRQLRERAELWSWYLRVQREAVGLYRHSGLEEFYPIPPPLPAGADTEGRAGRGGNGGGAA